MVSIRKIIFTGIIFLISYFNDVRGKSRPSIPMADHQANYSFEEKRLREELFVKRKINKDVRPADNLDTVDTVKVGLNIIHITQLNVQTEMLTLMAFIIVTWNDSRFKWNSYDYGGIEHLITPSNLVWKPDLTVYNHGGETDPFPFGETMVIMYKDGKILWVPPAKIVINCDVTTVLFPYDEHECFIKFGSWTHDGFRLDVQLLDGNNGSLNDISWDHFIDESNEWEIIKSRAVRTVKYYSCCAEPYPDVTFYFTLRRRSPYYTVTMVIPCVMFIFLTLVSFWLPPMAGEKILLGAFNLLYLIILLGHMHWAVPRSNLHVPCIVRLCGSITLLSMMSLLTNIITVSLSRKKDESDHPSCCQFIAKDIIVKLCCLPRNEIQDDSNLLTPSTSDQREDKEPSETDSSSPKPVVDWNIVAMTIDRTLFCVTLIAIPITFWYSFS